MEQNLPSPREFDIPHDKFRPGQYELLKYVLDNRGKFVVVSAPTGTGKCLDLDSYINTPSGLTTLRDLIYNEKRIISFDRDSMKIKESFPLTNFDIKKRKCIKIKTQKGYELICTPEHKITIWNENGEFEWVLAGDLEHKQKVYIPIVMDTIFNNESNVFYFGQEDMFLENTQFSIPDRRATNQKNIPLPNKIDDDLAYMAGIIVGDGCVTHKNTIQICSMDEEIVNCVYRIAERFGIGVGVNQKEGNKAKDYKLHSSSLKDFFVNGIGIKEATAREKEIPLLIFNGTKSQQAEFLKGLFDTDGSAHRGGVEYGTSSEKLAKQVHLLLLNFGIISKKSYREKTESYRILITGRFLRVFNDLIGFGIKRKQDRLNDLCNKDCNPNDEIFPYIGNKIKSLWKKFNDKHSIYNGGTGSYNEIEKRGMSRKVLESYWYNRNPTRVSLSKIIEIFGEELDVSDLETINKSPLFFDKIKSIENIGFRDTADIEVPEWQNFIADGFIVHNSSLAKGLGHQSQVLVLVHTLNLLTQYENGYGFSVVRGRQEYPCVNSEKIATWKKHYGFEPTAAECHFSPMWECPYSGECPYLQAKRKAISAKYAACTYRYAGLSSTMQGREGHLVMDEAHDAAEELIGFNSHRISEKELFHMELPDFPITTYGPDGKGAIITDETRGEIVSYLEGNMDDLAIRIDDTKEGADAQKVFDKYERIITSLFECDWFLRIEDKNVELLSLSAMHIAQRIFANKDTKMLMSATIGNPDPLTNVLGIDEYEFIEAPHPTPPIYRKVKDLHMDRMTHHNLTRKRELPFIQAQLIWRWISEFPEDWRGLIVTSSFQKIRWLDQNLQLFNKGKRRFIVQGENMNVSEAVEKFITDVQPGDIMIGTIQGMGSGLDLYGDLARMVVIAGVPHENPTDYYAKARRDQYGGIEYQYWNIFMQIVQAAGRAARGEKDEDGNWIPNFCALADGSATTKTAMKYYPQWFKEAIK